MSKRYHLTTFGCLMNEHDSERIKGMLDSLGYVEAAERADAASAATATATSAATSVMIRRPRFDFMSASVMHGT